MVSTNKYNFGCKTRDLSEKLKFHINFVYLLLEGSILDKKVYNFFGRWLSVRVTM